MGNVFSQNESESRDPRELLSSAAAIVARQREEEERYRIRSDSISHSDSNRNSPSYYSSIAELVRELLLGGEIRLINHNDRRSMWTLSFLRHSSSDEDEDMQDSAANNSGVAENGAVPNRVNTDLTKSFDELALDVRTHSCGSDTGFSSLLNTALRNRELGCSCPQLRFRNHVYVPGFVRPSTAAWFPCQRARITNSFLPNRRKVVDKVRTKVFCCSYLPGENGLLTASQDEIIRLYERKGPRQRYELTKAMNTPFVGWSILDMVVSPDGRHCIYSTWSEKLYQKTVCGDEEENDRWITLHLDQAPEESRFAVFSLRFNHDGSEIICGSSDCRLYVFDRQSERTVCTINAHDDDVNSVSFGDTSRYLVFSAGDDGLCKVWDCRDLGIESRPAGVFAGHRDGITFIDNKDDRYILTNSKDQTIKVWDIRKFSSAAAERETRAAVASQRWDYRYQPAPRTACSAPPLKEDGSVMTFRGHIILHTLIRARFSPERTGRRFIYTGSARGQCVVYDVLTGMVVQRLDGHRGVVRDCAWHSCDNEIITTSWDGETAVWRYDERVERNINPESWDKSPGDEESSDEYYTPIQPRRYNVKRRAIRRCLIGGTAPREGFVPLILAIVLALQEVLWIIVLLEQETNECSAVCTSIAHHRKCRHLI
ncbi:hypothetical protein AB6A40_000772 [Gnathostoma spinigerum]|uniref:Uncharacterized protein n=1 Tax=Gnathostoma spinigerum TaxID=75299 RepID=A0ABD6E2Q0_9BILA